MEGNDLVILWGGRGWREREKVAASLAALPTTNHQVSFLLLQSVAAYWTFPSEVEKKLSQLQKNPIVFLSSFFFFFSSVNFNLRPWREKLLLRSFFFLFCKESLDSQTFCVRAIVLITVDKKAAYISRLRSSVWVGFSAQVSVMRCIFGAMWQTARKDNFFFIVNFIMCSVFIINTNSCFKKNNHVLAKLILHGWKNICKNKDFSHAQARSARWQYLLCKKQK